MKEVFAQAEEFLSTDEGREIAKALAKHGLGICIPHMHEEDSGTPTHLPPGMVSHETNLQVSFVESQALDPVNAVPVAWRWNGTQIEVCGGCCGMNPPPTKSLKASAK